MWKNNNTFPWMNAKGSDVMLVLRWLADYLPILTREARHPEHEQIMDIFWKWPGTCWLLPILSTHIFCYTLGVAA